MKNVEISIHDNEIHSYEMCFPEKNLTFKTSYLNEQTDIQFAAVLAYSFAWAGEQNVLFEAVESSIEGFVRWYSSNKDTQKAFENGFPIEGFATPEDLLLFLKSEEYRYYELNASVGLDGFVIAKDMKIVPRSV